MPAPRCGRRNLGSDCDSHSLPRTLTSPVTAFDLQIALCAFEGGARELWSHDTPFVTIAELRLVQP
jgi:hypothetical protein